MNSSRRVSRSRYRFGFRGKPIGQNLRVATTDEILDSLTRHVELMEKDREERTLGLQTVLGTPANEAMPQASGFEPGATLKHLRNRSFGRYAFATMLAGGLAFLWAWARLPTSLSLQSLASIQEIISRAGFADWQRVALMALSAFTAALIIRHSRNNARSRFFTSA